MFHVYDEHTNRFRIPARDFNAVASFCNNFIGGVGVTVKCPDRPGRGNPVRVSLNEREMLELGYTKRPRRTAAAETEAEYVEWAAPQDVANYKEDETTAEKLERVGTSKLAAPLDHVHRMPFGINPLADGEEEDNVQPEEIYAPDEGEDVSETDLSGTSPYAARADHTHPLPADGVHVSERVIYENIYSPSGTSHYYGTKVTVTIKAGLVTQWDVEGVYDLFTGELVGSA